MHGPIVVVGAGISGVSTAFHLTELGHANVVVCDPRPPLTLTSDKSTECYRNWWPSPAMVGLTNRSIDLLERYDGRSHRAIRLNRRGYLYLTTDRDRLDQIVADGVAAGSHGAGELRQHRSATTYPPHDPSAVLDIDGADLLDPAALRELYPYLSRDVVGGLHARRAGWLSAQQLGAWMLDEAKKQGVRMVVASVEAIDVSGGAVRGVELSNGSRIATDTVIDAAGPMIDRVAAMVGVDLRVHSEAHFKTAFRDHARVIPRDAPMLIWCDPQDIAWTKEEAEALIDLGRAELVETMPAFCHGRPEGSADSPWFLALWEYHRSIIEPVWPMPGDDLYPEVVLRGMSTMIPGLSQYKDHMPQPFVDGGYYTKAPDNRPLVGPTEVQGFHLCGAVSGYGIMVSAGVGELAARWALGSELPSYAAAFTMDRFDDPAYVATIADSAAGQL